MNDVSKPASTLSRFYVFRWLARYRLTPRNLFVGAALVISVLWLLVAAMLFNQRSAALEREAIHTTLLSHLLAARTLRALSDAATLAAGISEKVASLGAKAALAPLPETLFRAEDGLIFVAIIDAEGRLLNATRGMPPFDPSVMSDWVKIAQQTREPGPRLGPLSLDAHQKARVVPMIAPIVSRDGRHIGTVVVGISPLFLTQPYTPRDLGQWARVMVVGPDGRVWARASGSGETGGGEDISHSVLYRVMLAQQQGSGLLLGALDTVERVDSFTQIAQWTIGIVAGTATDEVLAVWKRQVIIYVSFGLLITALIALLALWAAYGVAREGEIAAALSLARDEAEAASRFKSEFVTTMSHEVRTPLSSVVGYAELLAQREFDQEARQNFAKMIMQAGQQITRIVDDLLDISRIEAGNLSLNYDSVVTRDLIDVCIGLHRKDAPAKTLALAAKVEDDVPDSIYTDHTRLTQILSNLLANSVKFTTQGFVLLHVTTRDNRLLFAVSDSGPGIARKYRSQIFERFRQGEPELSIKHGGTGLGLPLVKALAIMLGGSVKLESEEGKGSTFTVELPIKDKPPGGPNRSRYNLPPAIPFVP